MKFILQSSIEVVICVVIVVTIAFGGGSSVVTRLSALILWICLLVLVVSSTPQPRLRSMHTLALALASVCIVWTLLQTSTHFWDFLSKFSVAGTSMFPEIRRKTLSIAPWDTLQTLVTVLFPLAVFTSIFHTFTTEEKVTRFIAFHCTLGASVGLYANAIYLRGNHWLLFSEKRFYLNDLTAVFVNRNTAANYLGMTLIGLTALIACSIQKMQLKGRFARRKTQDQAVLVVCLCGWLSTFLAMMLTSSRAGAATALLSVGIVVVICLYDRMMETSSLSKRISWLPWLTAFCVILAIIALTYVFASKIFFRIQSDWTYDPRFCIMPGLFRLWLDNWIFGTGLGTFPLAFPPYKDAACGLAELWLQAHNFYIEGAITFGLPFLIICSVTIPTLFWCFAIGLKHRQRYKWVSAFGIGLLIQQLLHNSIDFPIQNVAVAVAFASLMAACIVVSLRRPGAESRVPSDVGYI